MQTMDDGKHEILPVAGAILDHAQVPVMLPRQSDADMRRDGSMTAQTVPNPPSMSDEECTSPQESQAGIGSTRWMSCERTLSQDGASPDTVERRRRRWPKRERDPGLRGQDKGGSPIVIQALARACLSPCRSVGSRAAPSQTIKDFNAIFGTVRYLFASRLRR